MRSQALARALSVRIVIFQQCSTELCVPGRKLKEDGSDSMPHVGTQAEREYQ